MGKNKLLLIDGNSVAYRAFFAMHHALERFKNHEGLHTNAIYAFHNMICAILKQEQPTHVLVAFDAGKTTFRTTVYKEYKAGRNKTPEEFKEQLPYIKDLTKALGLFHYELKEYEADDIIGTMAKQAKQNDYDVVIVSGDKDLTQLADETVTVLVTKKGVSELETYTPKSMAEKYNGLAPHQIIDMKGLAGDTSDNIPGVPGVGPKTAIRLLKKYETVEGVYDHLNEMKPSKMKEKLIQFKEDAFLSKQLATIHQDAPVRLTLDKLSYNGTQEKELLSLYQQLDFHSFLKKRNIVHQKKENELSPLPVKIIDTIKEEYFGKVNSLYIEILEENYHTGDIQAVSFSNGKEYFILNELSLVQDPLFQQFLLDETKQKVVFDAKKTIVALKRLNSSIKGIVLDVLLASYILNTNDKSSELYYIAQNFGYETIHSDEQVYGKGSKRKRPEDEVFYQHLAYKLSALFALKENMIEELKEKDQLSLFETIELPLSYVLAKMETTGFKVDDHCLKKMKKEFLVQLKKLEYTIYEQAGETFNLNSPKQLGVILFEKMGLPVIKKTKTGYSTAVDVLEQLRPVAPIVKDILTYRQMAKLQSTYVEGLLKVIQDDGKIHTRYQQALTQTGRLSSVDPNLQNIPIRLEEGRKIRQAFVPSQKDWVIYSSDYSQIELRVLAHISKDKHLQEAFLKKEDIHTATAMRVFDVTKQEVTSDMRRQAKAVNFGIVYGISDYGLSQNLNISRKKAQQYIDIYFEKYPNVRVYMEKSIKDAKEKGYVETLYHRKRYLPDLYAKNFNIRSFAERTAMNTPIQGSAADIIKIAMIEMEKRLKEKQLKANLLVQVHDELVFEVDKKQIDQLDCLVKEVMEKAVCLDVPLVVDSHYGLTWYEAK